VVLAARDEGRGLQAAEALHAEGLLNVVFHQLAISSAASVTQFLEWIRQTYGGLDILVRYSQLSWQLSLLSSLHFNYHTPSDQEKENSISLEALG